MPPVARRSVAPAVALAVVLAGLAVWWVRPFSADAGPGTQLVLEGSAADVHADHPAVVMLPGQRMQVSIGTPSSTPPGYADDGSRPGRASRGAVWVPVRWSTSGGASFTDAQVDHVALAAQKLPVTLAVHAGGRTITLDPDQPPAPLASTDVERHQGSVAVVVPKGDVDDLTVDVGFEGVVQHVHADGRVDAGLAQPLYDDLGRSGFATSRLVTPLDPSLRSNAGTRLTYELGSLEPWDPDLGWVSAPGQGWLTLHLESDATRGMSVWPRTDGGLSRAITRGSVRGYGLRPTSTTAAADGVASLTAPAVSTADGHTTIDVRWLVDGPPTRLTVSQGFDVAPRRGGYPMVPSVTLTATLTP